ncbi:MAG: deoxyribodipyrimidine photo-lyase [Phycisphaeraceae bacterium]|nr:deoxyribodipyrimidine photo-lyase [Phycisphaeraceae bacterium]
MSEPLSIVWFGRDLRLADHEALNVAAKRGAVLPVFVLAPQEQLGGASKWWLHQSLSQLDKSLRNLGGRLILRRGDPRKVLAALMCESGADAVFWQRRYEPDVAAKQVRIKRELGDAAGDFAGYLLHEPQELLNKQGKPYQVFTPFWRAFREMPAIGKPLNVPRGIEWPKHWPKSDKLSDLNLMPAIQWYDGLAEHWSPGEIGAKKLLSVFAENRLIGYARGRDFPGVDGTSRLSPHLHFGEISPRQVWCAVNRFKFAEPFLRQLAWREFAYHVLYHFPHTPAPGKGRALKPQYDRFPWRNDDKALRAWQRGRTGYPIVDAGMRQLWRTGWMHNRVRMIVASFMVKDLLIDWRVGAAWFMDTLVDADLANNTMGWQWAAGCGADAAPFFRIFNPVLQGRKFDPEGKYVRQWVNELRGAADKTIHEPYGEPIVDHAIARDRALAALQKIKR